MVQLGEWDINAKAVIAGDTATGLAAAGTTQATGTLVTAGISMFTTVATGGAATLMNEGAARKVIFNGDAADALSVFPPVGGTINGAAANAAFSVPFGKGAMFITSNGVTWVALLSA
jgi:hypothetical protein